MMATTHALVGAGLGASTLAFAPELAPAAMLVGAVGGALPDIDVYAAHRRTFHFPVLLAPIAVLAVAVAAAVPGPLTLLVAVGLAAAAVHSAMDLFGGGLELEPWKATSDRAVYNHALGRWHAPRRWVDYDGSPRDLALATAVGLPTFLVASGLPRVQGGIAALLTVSAGYTLVRRHLPVIAAAIVGFLPSRLVVLIPARFDEIASAADTAGDR
jgi:hypothetical protein